MEMWFGALTESEPGAICAVTDHAPLYPACHVPLRRDMTFGIEPDSMPSARRPSNITMSAIGRFTPSARASPANMPIATAKMAASQVSFLMFIFGFPFCGC